MKISYAPRRTAKKWTNTDMTWQEITQRLSTTKRTPETIEQYLKLSAKEQSEIKDVGGFVAGHLKEGRRRKGHVLSRSALALDIDFAPEHVWLTLAEEVDWQAAVYTTHKHTPQHPRVRLVIPLSRDVSAEEYVPLARAVAAKIGIDMFDDSTYEPQRLMFWPSTSTDGEYIFDTFDGPLLDPDTMLGEYDDWRDASTWPVSSRQAHAPASTTELKQADPSTKTGIVGAFCRAYPINEAITQFLSDVYTPTDQPGRYTYIPGETTAGLVIYDDTYAYSHHGTDPAGQVLCNAFDLVRIHKFGDLDEDPTARSGGSAPSFRKMEAWAEKLDAVRTEQNRAAAEEFKKITGQDGAWLETLDLEYDRKGGIKPTLTNLVTLLSNDPSLSGIAYDEMAGSIVARGLLPWDRPKEGNVPWRDVDDAHLSVYVEKNFARFAERDIRNALATVADKRTFNPVKEFLKKLPEWDGVPRVDTLLIDYLGATDDDYTRAVTRKTLVAAVRRILHPGCKFDTMLILVGKQGIGKSTLVARLAGPWFNDSLSLTDTRDKTAAEKLQGFWILEFGELAGMRKADIEALRSFLSRQDDIYRGAYERRVSRHPRRCIFFGTTNAENGFLTDPAGNRRMWPVEVKEIPGAKTWDLDKDLIAQIWAEAKVLEKRGEPLHLTGEVAKMALERQREAIESDEREGMVASYLERPLPRNWHELDEFNRAAFYQMPRPNDESDLVPRDLVSVLEVWCECLGKRSADLTRRDSIWITNTLKKLGWAPTRSNRWRGPYGKQKTFEKVGV